MLNNITDIIFKNYKCFDSITELNNIAKINIIIGKNNIGKSSLLDIIEMINNPQILSANIKNNTSVYIKKVLTDDNIKPKGSSYYEEFKKMVGDTYAFELQSKKESLSNKYHFENIALSKEDDQYNKNKLNESYEKELLRRLKHIPTNIARIYAERNIVPEADDNEMTINGYGEGITRIIANYLNKEKYNEELVRVKLLNKLNEIMGSDAHFSEIITQQVEINNELRWEIFLKEEGKKRVALSKSGSGLKTILMVLVYTILLPNLYNAQLKDYVFLFEELENNLHPSLERRLLKYIKEIANKGATFFITTHSSTLIDSYQNKNDVQLYHIVKENNDVKVLELSEYYGTVNCLNDLGVKASDILQSNGIIWVEGPSDRIYINKWIELWSNGILTEGMDYQCMFYGGRLLSHLSANDEEVTELIKLINLNKNFIILIDSDKKNRGDKIRETKKRIKTETEQTNNYCWITKGREIENYIPESLIKQIYNNTKSKVKFTQYDEIEKIAEKISGKKAFNKVDFAKEIIKNCKKDSFNENNDLNKNMKEVVKRITEWNKE